MKQPIKEQKKTDITVNIHSYNLNGSNMYDLWVIKIMHSNAGEREFHYLQQNTSENDHV